MNCFAILSRALMGMCFLIIPSITLQGYDSLYAQSRDKGSYTIHSTLLRSYKTRISKIRFFSDTFLFKEDHHYSNFIDKWAFHALCQFTFDPETNSEMYPISTSEGGISFNPALVKRGDAIFLRASHADDFFDHIVPHIKHPFIIVSHGEYYDGCSNTTIAKYLNHQKVIAWFSTHPCPEPYTKLHAIPLGVWVNNRSYASHQELSTLFRKLRAHKKTGLVYANFAEWADPERKKLVKLLHDKQWCSFRESLPFLEYFEEMANYAFTLSPRGLGIDCYRTWEALLVGSIPIVKSSWLDSIYQDLPVLIINDWKELTEEFLLQKYKELTTREYSLEKLSIDYWAFKIASIREGFLNNP